MPNKGNSVEYYVLRKNKSSIVLSQVEKYKRKRSSQMALRF